MSFARQTFGGIFTDGGEMELSATQIIGLIALAAAAAWINRDALGGVMTFGRRRQSLAVRTNAEAAKRDDLPRSVWLLIDDAASESFNFLCETGGSDDEADA